MLDMINVLSCYLIVALGNNAVDFRERLVSEMKSSDVC